MIQTFGLFLVFCGLATGVKLLTAWTAIDMFLPLCYWVGTKLARGTHMSHRWAWGGVLVLCVIGSDMGFQILHGWPVVYPGMTLKIAGLLGATVLGALLPRKVATCCLGLMGLGAGLATFFVLSNLGVFLSAGFYPPTFEGLIACYVAALPFLKTQAVSNVLTWVAVRAVEKKWVQHPVVAQGVSQP